MMNEVQQALIAVRNQDWNEALTLVRKAEYLDLDPADRATALRVRAAALRRRGQWKQAREDYLQLRRLFPADQEVQLEVLLGLADCYEAVGNWNTSYLLLESALDNMEGADATMRLRIESSFLSLQGRQDPTDAKRQFKKLLAKQTLPQGPELAVTRFYAGELYWAEANYKEAIKHYDLALQLAQAYDALKTAADCICRTSLAKVFMKDPQWIYSLKNLIEAEKWYEMIGDRSSGHIYTELGEIYKHQGRLDEAQRSFERGITLMEGSNENVRLAHNYLGLADVYRQMENSEKAVQNCDQARALYRQLEHPWGIVLSTYLAALLGDPWPKAKEWQRENFYNLIPRPELGLLEQVKLDVNSGPLQLRYVD